MEGSGREITAEIPVQSEEAAPLPSRTPTVIPRITFGAKTDLGRLRENNEDKFDFMLPEAPEVLASRGCVFAVADGMGGHAAGQIAAELALKAFLRDYYSSRAESPGDALARAMAAANAAVYDAARSNPNWAGMGSTLCAAAFVEDRLWVAHVGDSRAYMLRSGVLKQLTDDHSWVAEQVRRGAMSRETAEKSPFRNVITRSIGAEPAVEPDVSEHPLAADDVVLLCSDGLTGPVPDDEIRRTLEQEGTPSLAAARLVELANDAGGPDNITVVIVRVDALVRAQQAKRRWPPWRSTE